MFAKRLETLFWFIFGLAWIPNPGSMRMPKRWTFMWLVYNLWRLHCGLIAPYTKRRMTLLVWKEAKGGESVYQGRGFFSQWLAWGFCGFKLHDTIGRAASGDYHGEAEFFQVFRFCASTDKEIWFLVSREDLQYDFPSDVMIGKPEEIEEHLVKTGFLHSDWHAEAGPVENSERPILWLPWTEWLKE